MIQVRCLISIQALYDYKSTFCAYIFAIHQFQFKHCTIISTSQDLDIKETQISIQALYDYKVPRNRYEAEHFVISIQALYDYKESVLSALNKAKAHFNSSIVRL